MPLYYPSADDLHDNENDIEAIKSLCAYMQHQTWDTYMEDHTEEAY